MNTSRNAGLPSAAIGHLEQDEVAWLTTTTDRGAPAPTPVWFVWDGEAIVIFCEATARKAGNIAARPRVTFHFNTDPAGQDVVVLSARGEVFIDGFPPSEQPGYIDKYFRAIGKLGMTVADFDAVSAVRLRLTPISAWLGG